MSNIRTCERGHSWEAREGTGDAESTVCPVCTSDGVDIPPPTSMPTLPPPTVEGYEIIEELGRGGMGVVYKATDLHLKRFVALKMIRDRFWATEEARIRFRREAEMAAQLLHPQIVQVYAVGEKDGFPYIVMEYVDGVSLEQNLAGTPMAPRQAAQIGESLARALQTAHDRQIVHRDLKPANILVTKDGVLKIADFGIAKRVQQASGLTPTQAILGTPSYMSPEQAGRDSRNVGPPADIYSLGAVLYELLTGRPPHLAETTLETLLLVLHEEPVAPTRLQPRCPLELETIVLKCLDKEPQRRYARAVDLAEDLARFLRGEPILARPPGWIDRGVKWVRRQPLIAGLLALIVGITLTGVGLVVWKWWEANNNAEAAARAQRDAEDERGDALLARDEEARARAAEQDLREKAEDARGKMEVARKQAAEDALLATRAKERAEKAEAKEREQKEQVKTALREAEVNLYYQRIALAERLWRDNQVARAVEKLQECPEELRRWEWYYVRQLCNSELLLLRTGDREVEDVAFSPNGQWIALCGGVGDFEKPGRAKLFHAVTGKELFDLRGHRQTVWSVTFSPDSARVATCSRDGTVRLWNCTDGKELATLDNQGIVYRAAFHPEDKILAVGAYQHVALWDTLTHRKVGNLAGHSGGVYSVAYNKDGTKLASAGAWSEFGPGTENAKPGKGEIKIWDVRSGKELLTIQGPETKEVGCVAWSPDGKFLASVGAVRFYRHDNPRAEEIDLWDAETGKQVRSFHGHTERVFGIAFRQDGQHLASCSEDQTVRIWDVASGKQISTWRGHTSEAMNVAFSPDGERLISAGSYDGTGRVWDARIRQEGRALSEIPEGVTCFDFSADEKHVACGFDKGIVRVWETSPPREAAEVKTGFKYAVQQLAVHPEKKWIAVVETGGKVQVTLWDWGNNTQIWKRQFDDTVSAVAWSPDGKQLALGLWSEIRLLDTGSGELRRTIRDHGHRVHDLRFSLDGSILVSACGDNTVRICSPVTGTVVRAIPSSVGAERITLTPDGKKVIVGGHGYTLKMFEVESGKFLHEYQRHAKNWIFGLSMHPKGERMISTGHDGVIHLWDVQRGAQLLSLRGPTSFIHHAAFSPLGNRIAAVVEGKLVLWDGMAGR